MQDHQNLDTIRSAGSTTSATPRSSKRCMKSLADELGDFDDVELSPTDSVDQNKSPKESHEEITEATRRVEDVVPEDVEQPTATPSPSTSPAIADTDQESPTVVVIDEARTPATEIVSNAALDYSPRKSNFVEQFSPVESASQNNKGSIKLMASIHNRELIDRKADGFFNMETMPSATHVKRRVEQSKGIATLQRTLIPPPLSNTASASSGSSRASSSAAVDSVKRPSKLRKVTLAQSSGRRPNKIRGPYPYSATRPQAASGFSLGRDLVAANHRKKLPGASAPARFVRLPTDPAVNFKRNFSDFGLKVRIPEPELDEYEEGDSGSGTSIPDVDSGGNLKFKVEVRKPRIGKVVEREAHDALPKLDFGVPRIFISNQCRETSCPIRFAHAKGPYHHRGHRHDKIMTGLFGHSNPPPEIWNAYRNMVHLTCDGEVISPDGRPGSSADDDLVVAFAMFHYGELNGFGGEEFHRRYAGKHMSSRISLRSSSTNSSKGSCGS